MSLENFILTCEKDNEQLIKDINYYKNHTKRLLQENKQLKSAINEIDTYLGYYFIDNMKFKDSQEEFKKLRKIIDKAREYIKENYKLTL